MRFILSIELGNDDMRTAGDIRAALRDLSHESNGITGGEPREGDSGTLRDVNGNRVGSWHVSE